MKRTLKNFVRVAFLTLVGLLVHVSSFAQCAMCRASVENNVSNGDTSIGAGLNNGILYLFLMPYLIAATLGFFWYRTAKRKRAKLATR